MHHTLVRDAPRIYHSIKVSVQGQQEQAVRQDGLLLLAYWRDLNHVRTRRWRVHEPVQTLVNSFISFSDLQTERKCTQIPPSAPKRMSTSGGHPFSIYRERRDLNPHGVFTLPPVLPAPAGSPGCRRRDRRAVSPPAWLLPGRGQDPPARSGPPYTAPGSSSSRAAGRWPWPP